MPADMSYLCGISPPFTHGSSLLSIPNHIHSCRRTHNHSQDLVRVPHLPIKDLKSCLKVFQQAEVLCDIHRPNQTSITFDSKRDQDMTEKKEKRVRFADAQGGDLTLVKYLTEATNEPPKSFSSMDFLKGIMRNLNLGPTENPSSSEEYKLVCKFDQPVADYVIFKQKIDAINVSLENVVIKSNSSINGTVKVKNIAFQKVVLIRVTFDKWNSYTDVNCTYVKKTYDGGNFDTFQFDIEVKNAYECSEIQFCVCYTCGNEQFWDNNNGKNYTIEVSHSSAKYKPSQSKPMFIPKKCVFSSYPSTYCELPSPQHNTWLQIGDCPFY